MSDAEADPIKFFDPAASKRFMCITCRIAHISYDTAWIKQFLCARKYDSAGYTLQVEQPPFSYVLRRLTDDLH